MIPRAEFLTHLAGGTKTGGKDGRWRAEFDTAQVADWQPGAQARRRKFLNSSCPGLTRASIS